MIKFQTFLENKITQKDNFRKNDDLWTYLRNILKPLLHKQQVEFALYCAQDILKHADKQTKPLAERCINLVEQWLQDPESVTPEELRQAARVAYAAPSANSAVYAASYAASAAAAATANTAANYGAYAAHAANVAHFNSDNHTVKMQQYIQIAKQLHPSYLQIEKSHSDPIKVQEIIKHIQNSKTQEELAINLDYMEELIPLEGLHSYFHVKDNTELAALLIKKKTLLINILNKL